MAELKVVAFKNRIGKAYNRKVLERLLDVGDLVLRRTAATGKAQKEGKLTANWEGSLHHSQEACSRLFHFEGNGRQGAKKLLEC